MKKESKIQEFFGLLMNETNEITVLLQQRDTESLEKLLPLVYDELREMATRLFRHEFRINHTLQPTALVHEAYLKLVGNNNGVSWQNRTHFFGIAARAMRQILVNHAIARKTEKRGAGQTMLALDEVIGLLNLQNIEVMALNEALEKLATLDTRQAQVVELRFFGGLTIEETAEVLKVSDFTVKSDWEMARSWLYLALKSTET
jgi:RNA polymerase sigma-70 factor (ECF subfamily)